MTTTLPALMDPGTEVDERIHVLLVDDNEQWATFVGGELESHDPDLDVVVVASATEALLTLRESDSIDCVVTDYRMPDIDGIALLERVREEFEGLPFILITAQGNEDVASRAIAAGVSDYLRKDPRADQISLLATKIRAAVTKDRLQRAVEASEARYRTVIEQSEDAILVVQNVQVVFCNRRFCELVGASRTEILEGDVEYDAIHPDDRERCRSLLRQWDDGHVDEGPHSLRITSGTGELRYLEFTGKQIIHDQDPAVLVTVRDVTRRVKRERARERERELSQAIHALLLTGRNRADFEAAVLGRLLEEGYDLAWIGESSGSGVTARAAAGETAYLEEMQFDQTDDHPGEPLIWTHRSGTAQFVSDFDEVFHTAWCRTALEHGLHAGAGLPLSYHGVSLGVLGVYTTSSAPFDNAERRLLEGIAETIAFAIYNFEREQSLTGDHTVEAVLRFEPESHHLTSLTTQSADPGTAELTVEGTLSTTGGRFLQYISSRTLDADAIVAVASEDDRFESVDVIATEPRPRIELKGVTDPPEAALASAGAVVRQTTVTPTGALVRVELAPTRDLSDIANSLGDQYANISVESVHRRERREPDQTPRYVDLDQLTEKQEQALRAAYHQGYFEHPRLQSAKEVASSLDISHSTFLQHLRVGERKVLGSLFEGS